MEITQPGWNGIVANLVKQPKWIVGSLPGVNGQNVPSLVEKECKKEQGL